jgi:soluble lytic murein transglycosylase
MPTVVAGIGKPCHKSLAICQGRTGTRSHQYRHRASRQPSASIAFLASARNVDPLLVHSLVREESRYNPMATSHSNALGLMQLLPNTAFGIASKAGATIHDTQDVYVPANKIKLGTYYISYVLNRFDGNALAAVASYNGGPNAVASWLKKFKESGQSDFDVFVEDIPLKEPRDYVRKVFGAYWNYEDIYGKPNV